VNGVAPGAVLLPEETSDERREAVRQKTLVGHLGTPEDVARAVIYLIEAEHFVTGSILRVDGGRSLL
jgi:NAD(P)-dependent dehydrogenase (short-subunit alcohol dehydrogenase family)